jgi:hypothetical protein
MLPPDGCDGFVYLLQEREFFRSGEPIYTVGRAFDMIARFRKYPPSSVFIRCLPCVDAADTENRLVEEFKEIFVHRHDFGDNNFEGNCEQMKDAMIDVVWSKNLDVRTTIDMLPIKARTLFAKPDKIFRRVMEHEEVRRLFFATAVRRGSVDGFVEQANAVLGFNVPAALANVFVDVLAHVPALLDLMCPDWRSNVATGDSIDVHRDAAINSFASWIDALGANAHKQLLKNMGIWRADRAAARLHNNDAGRAINRLIGAAFGITVVDNMGGRWRIHYARVM